MTEFTSQPHNELTTPDYAIKTTKVFTDRTEPHQDGRADTKILHFADFYELNASGNTYNIRYGELQETVIPRDEYLFSYTHTTKGGSIIERNGKSFLPSTVADVLTAPLELLDGKNPLECIPQSDIVVLLEEIRTEVEPLLASSETSRHLILETAKKTAQKKVQQILDSQQQK